MLSSISTDRTIWKIPHLFHTHNRRKILRIKTKAKEKKTKDEIISIWNRSFHRQIYPVGI